MTVFLKCPDLSRLAIYSETPVLTVRFIRGIPSRLRHKPGNL